MGRVLMDEKTIEASSQNGAYMNCGLIEEVDVSGARKFTTFRLDGDESGASDFDDSGRKYLLYVVVGIPATTMKIISVKDTSDILSSIGHPMEKRKV